MQIHHSGSILTATINRPDALNAVDFDVMKGLEDVLTSLEQSDSTRVFILTGEGSRYFASGGDLRKFSKLTSKEAGWKMARRMENILRRIEELPCWTIASVNGDAYGGGCELMLAFDFRIAAKAARFGFTQRRFHLPPGWGGLTRLVERVGRATALEWLGGAMVINADEAAEKGMLNHVVADDQLVKFTMDWARRLAETDPSLIKALKEGARYALGNERISSIDREQDIFANFWAKDEHSRLVDAFLRQSDKKRK